MYHVITTLPCRYFPSHFKTYISRLFLQQGKWQVRIFRVWRVRRKLESFRLGGGVSRPMRKRARPQHLRRLQIGRSLPQELPKRPSQWKIGDGSARGRLWQCSQLICHRMPGFCRHLRDRTLKVRICINSKGWKTRPNDGITIYEIGTWFLIKQNFFEKKIYTRIGLEEHHSSRTKSVLGAKIA